MKKIFVLLFAVTMFSSAFAADGWTQAQKAKNFTTTDGGGVLISAAATWIMPGCSSTLVYIPPSTDSNRMLGTLMLAISQDVKVIFYGNCEPGTGYYFYASRISYVK